MLWMTRTPLRVSLFGGGTDYPEYFERHPGAVIGFTIDKYIHIAALKLTAGQPYNVRLAYSTLELAEAVEDIQHPVVREVLRHYDFRDRLDISIMSDLPATGSGLGSSSAFTVGFLKLLSSMRRAPTTKIDLARNAIMVERELLRENVGVQDQLHATFGGVNRFDFQGPSYRISPVQMNGALLQALGDHMVLVHTGVARRATQAVQKQIERTKTKAIDRELSDLYAMVGECAELLESGRADVLGELGRRLSESWRIKRGLTTSVSSDEIDAIFEVIEANGALGAKLCGAGGGGYFLALVPPERRQALADAVAPLSVIPIRIDLEGSCLVYPSAAPDFARTI